MNTAVRNVAKGGKFFNPHSYFKTRKGLYIGDTFRKRILSKQSESMYSRGCEGMKSFVLARIMSDQEIIDELLGGVDEAHAHAITLDQIAAKIDLQPNGEAGALINTHGRANLFYVLVDGVLFAVYVIWYSSAHMWSVSDWALSESGGWGAGLQIFCNMTLTL